jgi:hypothetical protein
MVSAGSSGHSLGMDKKTRLVEMEVAACVIALAIIAFTLMLGHFLWLSMVRR